MIKKSKFIGPNITKNKPKLGSLRFIGLLLSVLVLCNYYITQAAASYNSPIHPSLQSNTSESQSMLLNQTQGNFQVYIPVVAKPCQTNCYFVDSINGSDFNSGKSTSEPWQTLVPVNSTRFSPSDIIYFKRGSSWDGGLVITDSGEEGNPITFTAYGSGDKPIFRNPGGQGSGTKSVVINSDWVIVEDLLISDANDAGIFISPLAEHVVIQDNEATNVGIGVSIYNSQYNLVTRNYIHDLHMVVNTPDGSDDFGAIGVSIAYASHNEISYNSMVNCLAPSYDWGTDGGAVEWWGTSDDNYIHHNWATGDNGFLEVGGGTAYDNRVAYNISINNGIFSVIHLIGQFASDVRNFRIENNTIIETANPSWVVFGFDGSPSIDTFLLNNNILYIEEFQYISNEPSFAHNNNLYYLGGGTELGFTSNPSEIIGDPLFVDQFGENYNLMPSSPAIDAGIDLGFTLDFENNPTPKGLAPDIGAFEYQGLP